MWKEKRKEGLKKEREEGRADSVFSYTWNNGCSKLLDMIHPVIP